MKERYYALSEIQRILPTASVTIVELAEPAEVAPVAHALWICKSVDDNDNGEYTCSRCGCGEKHSIGYEVPYCWRCGAKMDGVIYNE